MENENEIREMKEKIMSILPVGGRELDIEEIIERIGVGIEYLNLELAEKALNELVQEKRIWIFINTLTISGKYISYNISFSLSEK